MSKLIASNTFTEGLMKDTNPLTTPNNVLTDCLNGTTITFNGKEFVLQNDMGNAIVDTASLKRNYVPIGLKEYNGIIYVISYNPLEDRVEIGSFPSPERDFSGEDFDNTDYQVQGLELKESDFYNSDQYTSVKVDNLPIGLGTEDYWKFNTVAGEPQFPLNKNVISDDFSLYEGLRLNTGDRFVLFYIDLLDGVGGTEYIDTIFKSYLSDANTRRLFKIEVYAVTASNRIKLNIDPMKYNQLDTLDFVNGTNLENLNYNVYNGDINGIIEIRISLELPDYFDVNFRQYPSTAPAVKFTTRLNSPTFMQIKGFRYTINFEGDTTIPADIGYMYYTQSKLYTLSSDYFTLNTKLDSTTLLTGFGANYGTYSYIITPFTQYGYENSLTKKGTFTVLENLVADSQLISLTALDWTYNDSDPFLNQITLHFTSTFAKTTDQVITAKYAELYDVWSNYSHVIDLIDPMLDTPDLLDDIIYTQTFDLNDPPTSFVTDNVSVYGMPYTKLQPTVLAKLPLPGVNYLDKVEYIEPIAGNPSLRKNHFYILAIYYKYHDTLLDTDGEVGIFRYFYTNDEFESFYGIVPDFSLIDYPGQTITINTNPPDVILNQTVTSTLQNGEAKINKSTLLFDPLLQEYNSITKLPQPKILSAYAVGPASYYSTIITSAFYATLQGIINNRFTVGKTYKYIIPDTTPGVFNSDIISLTYNATGTINLNSTARTISSAGGLGAFSSDPTLVCDLLDDLSYNVSYDKILDLLSIIYTSNTFNIRTNKLYPYNTEWDNDETPGHMMYMYPLFYQLSKEIQQQIANADSLITNPIKLMTISHPLVTGVIDQYEDYGHFTYATMPSDKQYLNLSNVNNTINHILNMNDYEKYDSWKDYTKLYGTIHLEVFLWYLNGVYGGVISSTYLDPTYMDLYVQLNENTKRLDGTTPLGAISWNGKQCQYDASDNIINVRNRQYLMIKSSNSVLEFPIDYNLVNILLFSGAAKYLNPLTYYKYYTETTKYYYENNTSVTSYVLDHTVTLSYDMTYCYNIMMGAKNRLINLREDGTDVNLRNYILLRFAYGDYSQPDLFPKCDTTAQTTLTYNNSINILANSPTINMQDQQDLYINSVAYQLPNHPVYYWNKQNIYFNGFVTKTFLQDIYGANMAILLDGDGLDSPAQVDTAHELTIMLPLLTFPYPGLPGSIWPIRERMSQYYNTQNTTRGLDKLIFNSFNLDSTI